MGTEERESTADKTQETTVKGKEYIHDGKS